MDHLIKQIITIDQKKNILDKSEWIKITTSLLYSFEKLLFKNKKLVIDQEVYLLEETFPQSISRNFYWNLNDNNLIELRICGTLFISY
ncbi:MAG: hypothetical protein F6K39_41200, partial [Okeania sp. SIO3B3]|nr:hypothetical protein [Okeania sp. SIO3B3]